MEVHVSNVCNRPCLIYQYSNLAPQLLGQTSISGVVFFVSKSLLEIERQKKLEKITYFFLKAPEPGLLIFIDIFENAFDRLSAEWDFNNNNNNLY